MSDGKKLYKSKIEQWFLFTHYAAGDTARFHPRQVAADLDRWEEVPDPLAKAAAPVARPAAPAHVQSRKKA